MSVGDIRLSVDLFDHPKIVKLERRAGFKAVKGLLILWTWAAKHRPDGVLSGMDAEDIEIASRWDGEEGAFVEHLVALRLLDEVDGAYHVHDWHEHQGWVSKADDRADRARFGRLAQIDRELFTQLQEAGVRAVTKDEYDDLIENGVHSATASRLLGHQPATGRPPAGFEPAPAPAPAPAPSPAHYAVKSIPDGMLVGKTPPATAGADVADEDEHAEEPRDGDAEVEVPPPRHKTPKCPHQEIIALYHELLPELPPVKVWNRHRRQLLQARWREDRARQSLDWWREYFALVRASPFLLGRGGAEFRADLEWLIRPRNMPKVLEGRYRGLDAAPGGNGNGGGMTPQEREKLKAVEDRLARLKSDAIRKAAAAQARGPD